MGGCRNPSQLIPFVQHDIPRRGIVAWSGSVDDLPHGMVLCDGTKYTPDLRDKFIVGAGNSYAPADTGGISLHNHDFTTNTHSHLRTAALDVQTGAPHGQTASNVAATGITNNKDGRPPFYALAYIMRKRWN